MSEKDKLKVQKRDPDIYQYFFNNARDLIFIIDDSYRIEEVSDFTLEFIGNKRDKVVGGLCHEILFNRKEPCPFCSYPLSKLGVDQAHHSNVQVKIQNRYFSPLLLPVRDESGQINRFIDHLRDITEIFRSQRELREKDRQYRDMVSRANTAILSLDRDGKIFFANESCERLFFWNGQNLLDSRIYENFLETRSSWEELFHHFIAEDETSTSAASKANVQTKARNGYGQQIWISAYLSRSETEGIYYFVCTDITLCYRQQELIEQQNRQLESIFAASPVGIGVVSSRRELLFVNGRLAFLTGYSQEELLHQNTRMLYPDVEEYEQAGVKFYGELKKKGHASIYTYWRKKNGEIIDVYINSSLLNQHDPGEGHTFSVQDVTSQRINERAIKAMAANRMRISRNLGHITYIYEQKKNEFIWAGEVYNVLGYRLDQLQSIKPLNFRKLIHPDDRKMVLRNFINAKRQGKNIRCEYRLRHANGNYIYMLDESIFLQKIDEPYYRVFGTLINIDERKRSEIALRQSEEKFRKVFENAPLGIVLIDEQLRFVDVNTKFSRMLGYAKGDLIGTYLNDVTFEGDWEISAKQIHELIAGKIELVQLEKRYVRSDGKLIWGNIHATSYNTETSSSIFFIALIEDITERIQTEYELFRSEGRLREASKLALLGHFEVDHIKKEVNWSEEMYHILDEDPGTYRVDYFVDCRKWLLEEDKKFFSNIISDNLKQKKSLEVEFRVRTRKGELRYVRMKAVNKYNRNDELVKVYGTLQDITKDKVNEKKLIEAKENAEKANNLKSVILSNFSHEVRTPMHAMTGFCEALKQKDLRESERDNYVDLIQANSYQLLYLLNDIVDLSKIELNQLVLNFASVNIPTLMIDLESYFKPQLKDRRGIQFEFHRNEENYLWVETDEARLKQIFTNLIGNALKFTEKGFVRFGYNLDKEKERVLFYVEDSGIGIDPEYHKLIFEHFGQVETDYARNYGGTGLGLTISKKLSEALGGDLWLESSLGKGSTFFFTIPFKEVKGNQKEIKESYSAYPNWQEKSVLVVEDDPISFMLLKKYLLPTKIKVFHAINGKEAVEMRKRRNFDLILMDMQLPVLDGYEATRMIRELDPFSPIIAQTANAMSDDRDICLQAGCTDYISKPYSKEKLCLLIRHYLD